MSAESRLGDPRVTAYVEAVCRRIRSRSTRQRVREEIEDHLASSITARTDRGESEDSAIAAAVAAMGDPIPVGAALARANRSPLLSAPFLAAFLACSVILIGLAARSLAGYWAERASENLARVLATHEEAFFEDQRILSKETFFDLPGRERDAGPYLNSRVTWAFDRSLPLYASLLAPAPLEIPQAIKDRMTSVTDAWLLEHASDPEWTAIDFSWMQGLSRFDHWDLFSQGRLADILRNHPKEANFATVPIPNFMVLGQWVKLRLMAGIRDRSPLPALREVRQLSRLFYSTEAIIGPVMATSVLDFERKAYDYSVSHGLIQASDWHPLSLETVQRARRAIRAHISLLDPWTPIGTLARAADPAQSKVGFCGALTEGAMIGLRWNQFFAHPWPLEIDYSEKAAFVRSILERESSHCALAFPLRLWSDPSITASWSDVRPFGNTWIETMRNAVLFSYAPHLPYLRQAAAAYLSSAMTTDFLPHAYGAYRLPSEKK